MKIILRADVGNVGKKGDVVEVSEGYARNYLVAKGLGLKATEGAVAQAASMRRSRDLKDARDREAAEKLAQALVPAVIRIPAKAGSEGRLFGSVTANDIVERGPDPDGCQPRPPPPASRRSHQGPRRPRGPHPPAPRGRVPDHGGGRPPVSRGAPPPTAPRVNGSERLRRAEFCSDSRFGAFGAWLSVGGSAPEGERDCLVNRMVTGILSNVCS